MKKAIKATVVFTVQDNELENGMPYELMDPDNFRCSFVETVKDAEREVIDMVVEALALSGGLALGSVSIETVNLEEG